MDLEAPRVLITRLSAIGDCVHTMPLVGVLRRRYPKAYIAWATQAAPATLLDGYPGLDEVIVVPRDWLKSLSSIRAWRCKLRSRRFEVAIDPQSLTKSAMLGWLSGASLRIGFSAPQGRELGPWLNNRRIEPRRDHVVDRYLELLQPLVDSSDLQASVDMPIRQHESISRFLDRADLRRDFSVINPGAGWDSKLWLPERFAQVARHLARHHQLPSAVVWAGDREREWAERIVAYSRGAAVLVPDTNLPELAELLHRARLCVAADTGPLHIAAAVGTPCVGLYGSTRPSVCGPYGQGHASVQAYYQDGTNCHRRRAGNDAMRAIEADAVTRACDQVLRAPLSRRVA